MNLQRIESKKEIDRLNAELKELKQFNKLNAVIFHNVNQGKAAAIEEMLQWFALNNIESNRANIRKYAIRLKKDLL